MKWKRQMKRNKKGRRGKRRGERRMRKREVRVGKAGTRMKERKKKR